MLKCYKIFLNLIKIKCRDLSTFSYFLKIQFRQVFLCCYYLLRGVGEKCMYVPPKAKRFDVRTV